MKIALASDLHFEFHRDEPGWLPDIAPDCDVIILAGDVGVGHSAVVAARKIAEVHPGAQILFVAGNHEFYKHNIDRQSHIFHHEFAACEQIHFLENESIEIAGYGFLGCTLWSGFDIFGEEQARASMDAARLAITDFSLITCGAADKLFTPQDAQQKFIDSRRWLAGELRQRQPEKTLVISHFPPCLKASSGYFENNILTAYFQANCQQLIEDYQPAIWCYGHNHFSDDFYIGHTHIVSNQLGYPREPFDSRYNPEKVIEV